MKNALLIARSSWALVLGLLILGAFLVLALLPQVFAPFGEQQIVGRPLLPPSAEFVFGTDEVGRDLLSRLIYGGRYEVLIAIIAGLAAGTLGAFAGLVAGVWGRAVDWIALRVMEVLLALPGLVLVLFLIAVWGRTSVVQVIALTVVLVPFTLRIARDATRVLMSRAFVEASIVAGASRWRLLRRHLIPNLLPTYVVSMTLIALSALVIVASLSYLGLGSSPSEASWGNILRASFGVVYTTPLMGVLSGACLIIVGISFSLIGSGVGALVERRGGTGVSV